ncbi:MAG: hypothetical protein HGN29_17070 [Asgard group archaeon]|nr:hypothetical protein [Asgard group archaeon]
MTEKNIEINLERLPIGIKYLKERDMPKDFNTIKNPKALSFCDAARLLHEEDHPNGLVVTLESLKACKWCPVSLGLKKPETGLEKNIDLLFDDLNQGVHIFNTIDKVTEPDVVTLVSDRENFEKLIETIGLDNFTREYFDQINFNALSLFTGVEFSSKREKRKRRRKLRSIRFFQWLFASRFAFNNKLMTWILTALLKQYWFSRMMDPILRKYSTGMSYCYTASAIPLVTQKANVVLAESGPITWGKLDRDSLLVGLPNSLFETLESKSTLQLIKD